MERRNAWCRIVKMLPFLSCLVSLTHILLIVHASICLIHFDTSHFVLNDILSWRDSKPQGTCITNGFHGK